MSAEQRQKREETLPTLPGWMTQEEEFTPQRDHEGFLTKSLLRLLSLLQAARRNAQATAGPVSVPLRMVLILELIVLLALSRNFFFVWVVLAAFLVRCALLPTRALREVMGSALTAGLFTAVLLLPAVLLGSPSAVLRVAPRVFLSVGMISLLSQSAGWNQITAALRAFHLPDLFILTLDMTLRSIVILGEICAGVVTAARLRSVGKSQSHQKTFAGILGVTFLRATELSEKSAQAMACRGFTGEYRSLRRREGHPLDLLYGMLLPAAVLLYLRLG